jgi:glyceraldehyde-3-phosphate dehydrogenase (NAD(P))
MPEATSNINPPARVLLVGYGVVGKRVADAIHQQPDMQLVGVVDASAGSLQRTAVDRQYPVFASSPDRLAAFKEAGIQTSGIMAEALPHSDIVIDAAPKGVTAQNVEQYAQAGKSFIVNGGEKHSLTNFSFSSLANYRAGIGKSKIRVVSCNTTALCRMLTALRRVDAIADSFVVIVRRGADPVRTSDGPINALVPVLGGASHHASDVQTVIPDLRISSMAVKVSTTLTHLHMLRVTFQGAVDEDHVKDTLRTNPRITMVRGSDGIISNAHVLELYRDRLRPRGDVWEVAVWEDSIHVMDKTVELCYCVHMESIIVPENVDAVRASLRLQSEPEIAVVMTDRAMGFHDPGWRYDVL